MRLRTVTTWAIPLVLLLAGVASACKVPVFRYALERWRPDPYRVTLFHRGPLTESEQTLASAWAEEQERASAPLVYRALDVATLEDSADPGAQQLFASLGKTALPTIVVQYPERFGNDQPLRIKPFNRAEVDALTNSPARQKLIRRLASGQTAVWLLLECGDREQDEAAAALLTKELKRLERELKLPELTDDPADELQAGPPLAIAFSVLRVPRSEEEAALVDMLLHSESDLADRKAPLVFPIFGRGRALFPIVGAGITAENIADYATFLVGECGCEVKNDNPGFDVLLTADWDGLLSEQGLPVAQSELPAAVTGAPVLVPIPVGAKAGSAPAASDERTYIVAWILGFCAFGVATVVAWLWRRSL